MLRNFSLDRRLVKNVRAVVTNIGTRLVTVQVLNENDSPMGDGILITRISFTYSLPSKHALLCRQFSLAPAYATTFKFQQLSRPHSRQSGYRSHTSGIFSWSTLH